MPGTPAAAPPRCAGEALLRAGLLYMPDLDLYLAKVLGGPRYQAAAEFSLHMVQVGPVSGVARRGSFAVWEGAQGRAPLGRCGEAGAPPPFHAPLPQQCIVLEPLLTAADLAHTLDMLTKLAARVSGGHSVLQLVDEARRASL